MDYHDFEEHIHAIILERGKEYFDRGAVRSMHQTPEGWTMSVEGQSTYKVVLHSADQLEEWFCECPHAHGPVCKHVAAALYAIRNLRDTDIARHLDALTEEELRALVRDEATRLPSLFEAILQFRPQATVPDEEE